MNPRELAANAEGEEHTLMATTSKQPGRSFSDERQLIELAKTMDLEAIAKRTGRKPEAVLNFHPSQNVAYEMERRRCIQRLDQAHTKPATAKKWQPAPNATKTCHIAF